MLKKILSLVVMCACFSGAVFAAGGSLGGTKDEATQSSDYKKAIKSIKKKDYASATGYLQTVVEEHPDSADAWNYLGYSHRNMQQYDQALSAYQKALELDPKHRGAHEYLGELYLQTNQLDKAMGQLERIDELCFLSCKEYRKLKKAIKKFEAG